MRRLIHIDIPVCQVKRTLDPDKEWITRLKAVQDEKICLENKCIRKENGLFALPNGFWFIPENMKLRKDLIILAHGNFIGAHKGINATLKTLKSWGIVWVNIRRD
ncbi:hypothetical protein ADUPG1_002673, partial [Aduncisulcus paluster]